ncbi:MAG: thioredoxin domain-containing protein [Bryobacteraceae bacterium]|jgi:protein-disulfide isomerase
MSSLLRFAALLALVCLVLPAQTDWTTATELPNVDFSGLTPTQKELALKILRGESCTCGCNMKLAECRIKDPPCGDSRALASIVVEGVLNHRTPDQIHEALVTSAIAKMRASQNRILGDPVEIATAGAPTRGPQSAKITIVEFSDFECPYCAIAVREIAAIMAAYPNDVKLVFKQFPLDDMHPHAVMAAEAALAANDQGKFWEMHDKLFANARQLSGETVFALAQSVGLDMMRFTRDMESGRFRKAVAADVAEGDRLGVFGTPSLFIDGKPYHGPVMLSILKPILDNELKPRPAVTAAAR